MVFFTCMHCNEALKKPRVEKHFQFQCRKEIQVSCMDCFKDFRGQEYAAHTQCISEAERYGGKNFVPRANCNKGEKKQQSWILVVQSVIENSKNLSSAERSLLNNISNYENIPRKKAKFSNFVKSIFGGRANMAVIESVWDKMEEALKKTAGNQNNCNTKTNENDTETLARSDSENFTNQLENENNENLRKEYEEANANGIEPANGIESSKTKDMKTKKSKKRKMLETQNDKNLDADACLLESQDVAKSETKKKKMSTQENSNNTENIPDNELRLPTKFNWKDEILTTVRSKDGISLKKLRKRIVGRYQMANEHATDKEKVIAKFDKKVKKMTEIVISEDTVKLAS